MDKYHILSIQKAFIFFARHAFRFIMSFEKITALIVHQVIETGLRYF